MSTPKLGTFGRVEAGMLVRGDVVVAECCLELECDGHERLVWEVATGAGMVILLMQDDAGGYVAELHLEGRQMFVVLPRPRRPIRLIDLKLPPVIPMVDAGNGLQVSSYEALVFSSSV